MKERIIVSHADGSVDIHDDAERPSLEEMQAFVGGFVQMLGTGVQTQYFGNEEGRYSCEENKYAQELLAAHDILERRELFGTIVILSGDKVLWD